MRFIDNSVVAYFWTTLRNC